MKFSLSVIFCAPVEFVGFGSKDGKGLGGGAPEVIGFPGESVVLFDEASSGGGEVKILYVGFSPGSVGGKFSFISLVVASVGVNYSADSTVAAEGALWGFLSSRRGKWEGKIFDMPIGPVAVATGFNFYMNSDANEEVIGSEGVGVGELMAFIPLVGPDRSGGSQILCFGFSTTCIGDWESLMPLVVSVLKSVKFLD